MSHEPLRCVVCGAQDFALEYTVCDLLLEQDGQWDFVCCRACGHGALDPVPDPEALAALYEGLYAPDKLAVMEKVSDSSFEHRLQRARLRDIERAAPGAVRRILDVGCGLGIFLQRLSERYPDAEALGVELAPQTAAVAAGRPGLTVHRCSFMELDLPEQSVDLLTMNHLLEHLSDPAPQLRRAAALLAPGGLIQIEIPHKDGWARRRLGRWYWGHLPPQHLQMFTLDGLLRLLDEAGFEPPAAVSRGGYPMNLTVAMILAIQNRFGSRSPHARRWIVRAPATALGLLALPATVLFDLTAGPLLDRWQGDILRVVARRRIGGGP